jgi:hypothetical protein
MQIGPTTAATAKPINRPRIKKVMFIPLFLLVVFADIKKSPDLALKGLAIDVASFLAFHG